MPQAEALVIAGKLGLTWEEFQKDYLDDTWPGVRTVLARHISGRCIFLEPQPDGLVYFCRIQTFKPVSCIEWQADLSKEDCRAGLSQNWQLEVDPENRLCGPPKKVAAFNRLLEELGQGTTQTGHD